MTTVPSTTSLLQRVSRALHVAFALTCLAALVGCSSAPTDQDFVMRHPQSSFTKHPRLNTPPPSAVERSLSQYLSSLVGAWDMSFPEQQESNGIALFFKEVHGSQTLFRFVYLPETTGHPETDVVFFVTNNRIWHVERFPENSKEILVSMSDSGCAAESGQIFFSRIYAAPLKDTEFMFWPRLVSIRTEYSENNSVQSFCQLCQRFELCGTPTETGRFPDLLFLVSFCRIN
ncbi:MAG: hypothetical protein U0640_04215 [Phycisphaerales bacterium]